MSRQTFGLGETPSMTDFEEHLARVDGMLLALEDLLTPPEEDQPFGRDDIPPPLETLPSPPGDRLTTLILRFNLSIVEADFLRMAVAAELSPAIADTFARLQGDRRLRRPQVALALRLIEPDSARSNSLIPLLHQDSHLRRSLLLELTPPWRDRTPLFTEHELALPSVLLHHLAGLDAVAADFSEVLTLRHPTARLESLTLNEATLTTLDGLLDVEEQGLAPGGLGPKAYQNLLLTFFGPYGTGRHSVAEVLAKAWGLKVLEIDLRKITPDLLDNSPFIKIVQREALRLGALPLFMHVGILGKEHEGQPPDPLRFERFLHAVGSFPGPLILCDEKPVAVDYRFSGRKPIALKFELPKREATRETLWWRFLSAVPGQIGREDVSKLASQFEFSPGQIRDAVSAAQGFAAGRDPGHPSITPDDLRAGCIAQLRHNLESLSHKAKNIFDWDDLILPDETKRQLRMFESFIRNRDTVYGDWGVGRKMSSGRGLKALFFGPSGTGKTMAAQVLSATLGIDLFKVDLSGLVSKWVGETEKNLDRVFTEAEKSHAVILFDEADSLFGKRGNVEKGTDRYSNMEVNYLLQRFEDYDGTVILTSNFPRGIDDAFSRRMHFMIKFPAPEEDMRERLWSSMFPPELPMADDVDIKRLAKQFELSGGNIKNIVLGASFIAADAGSPVNMLHLMKAIQWEYQKIGRTASRSEFQEFFDQLN